MFYVIKALIQNILLEDSILVEIRSNDRGRHTVHQMALYGVWQESFSSQFSTNTSLRVEYASNGGWVFVPQINLSYQSSKIQLRASAGYAYRNADFTELFNNYNRTGIEVVQLVILIYKLKKVLIMSLD